jgi:nucleotide-binding universal stress UspA family protein
MLIPKKILVPTDFSECDGSCSLAAVEQAISLSKYFGSELIFLHVISDDPYKKPMFFLDDEKIEVIFNKMKEASIEQMNNLIENYASEIEDKCTIKLRIGKPSQEIINEATESDIDLIVIATRGSGNVHSTVFGSTTNKVIQRATCSVLVSKNGSKNTNN